MSKPRCRRSCATTSCWSLIAATACRACPTSPRARQTQPLHLGPLHPQRHRHRSPHPRPVPGALWALPRLADPHLASLLPTPHHLTVFRRPLCPDGRGPRCRSRGGKQWAGPAPGVRRKDGVLRHTGTPGVPGGVEHTGAEVLGLLHHGRDGGEQSRGIGRSAGALASSGLQIIELLKPELPDPTGSLHGNGRLRRRRAALAPTPAGRPCGRQRRRSRRLLRLCTRDC